LAENNISWVIHVSLLQSNKLPEAKSMKKAKQFLLTNANEFVGESLGVSEWVDIDQEQVNIFGKVTHWEKPGHVDPDYGKATPYGGTLIHGFHMVALCSYFFESAGLRPEDGDYSLNYGLNKVRMLQPVVINDGIRLRSHVSLLGTVDKGHGQQLMTTCHQVEVEGQQGHALYAEYLSYWFPKQ
jgi:acyl dehydratase